MPPPIGITDETTWPAPLRPLCQSYGADAVWMKGLEILGYPPSWIGFESEVSKLTDAIANERTA